MLLYHCTKTLELSSTNVYFHADPIAKILESPNRMHHFYCDAILVTADKSENAYHSLHLKSQVEVYDWALEEVQTSKYVSILTYSVKVVVSRFYSVLSHKTPSTILCSLTLPDHCIQKGCYVVCVWK